MEKAIITIVNPITGFYTCVKVNIIHVKSIVDKHTIDGKLTSVITYISNVDNKLEYYK